MCEPNRNAYHRKQYGVDVLRKSYGQKPTTLVSTTGQITT
jgi:hypothetical protein